MAEAAAPRGQPWILADLTRLVWRVTAGLAALFGAWVAASGSDRWSIQQACVVVGIGGVVVSSAGCAAWLLEGSRRVRARQARLMAVAAERVDGSTDPARVLAPAARAELVSTPAMTRYHRPDCELVAGKAARPGRLAEHEAAGRRACQVCEPTEVRQT